MDIDPNTVGSLGGNIKLKPNAAKAHDAWEQQITKAYADLRANPSSTNRAKVDELLKVEPEFPPEKVGTADYLDQPRDRSSGPLDKINYGVDLTNDKRFTQAPLKFDEQGNLFRDQPDDFGWNYKGVPEDEWVGRGTEARRRASNKTALTEADKEFGKVFEDYDKAEAKGLIQSGKSLGFKQVKKRFDEWISKNPSKSVDDFFRVFDESDQGKSGKFVIPKSVRDSLKGSSFARGGMIY